MSNVVNFNLRLEKDLKEQVGVIFENYGMTTAQALRMFLVNVAKTKKVPLSLDYQSQDYTLSPKGEALLRQSMQEIENGEYTDYHSVDELMKGLAEIAHG